MPPTPLDLVHTELLPQGSLTDHGATGGMCVPGCLCTGCAPRTHRDMISLQSDAAAQGTWAVHVSGPAQPPCEIECSGGCHQWPCALKPSLVGQAMQPDWFFMATPRRSVAHHTCSICNGLLPFRQAALHVARQSPPVAMLGHQWGIPITITTSAIIGAACCWQ
jgi:hypothetical protein